MSTDFKKHVWKLSATDGKISRESIGDYNILPSFFGGIVISQYKDPFFEPSKYFMEMTRSVGQPITAQNVKLTNSFQLFEVIFEISLAFSFRMFCAGDFCCSCHRY